MLPRFPDKIKTVIPGFNTDIEHNGTTYHVQTEDKGLNSPLILSLIYTGGAILASKRTPYEDLIASGLDDAILAERLERQHKLICAAIKAGRIDDLKRMSDKGPAASSVNRPVAADAQFITASNHAPTSSPQTLSPAIASPPPVPPSVPVLPSVVAAESTPVLNVQALTDAQPNMNAQPKIEVQPKIETRPNPVEHRAENSPTQAAVTKPISTPLPPPAPTNQVVRPAESKPPLEQRPFPETAFGATTFDAKLMGTGPLSAVDLNALHLSLLDEQDLRAGELAVLCVRVGRGINGADPVADAEVTVKILGTTFHPIIISQKTNQFGMTVARVNLPKFAAGRAAILVRAEFEGKEVMLRRVIQRS